MQDLIILNRNSNFVLIQKDNKIYEDSFDNFIIDYGGLPKIEYTPSGHLITLSEDVIQIDYNKATESCWLNGYAFQTYPNEVCETILNSLDTIIAAKKEREYVEPTLEELKEAKIKEVGALFAKRRDAIRFIDLPSGKNYGFDCTSEDITNFMAAYTPLMIEKSGSTGYKVWLNQTTKGLVTLDYADMKYTYDTVRTSQLEAYTWYEAIKLQFNACTTKEELDNITLE